MLAPGRRRRSRRAWSRSGCARSRARRCRSNPSGGRAAPCARALPGASSTSSRTAATASRRRCSAGAGRSPSLALLRGAACRPRRRAGAGPRSCSAASSPCSRSCCWPTLFTHFADAVSISQARRAAGFVPFAVRARRAAQPCSPRLLSLGALPVGLGGGHRASSSPIRATSATRSTTAARRWRPGSRSSAAPRRWSSEPSCRGGCTELDRHGTDRRRDRRAGVLPVALHGFTHWDERPTAARGLTPGLVEALRDRCARERASSSPTTTTSYAIAAFAPVYVADALPGHVADTKANRPYARRADAREFFRTGNLAIPRRYGATWLVVDRNRSKRRLDLPQVYSDARYVLYRLRLVKVLLVSMYFPPAGGGGVQRTLKTATHLPALGIETHVLAPDDPKWVHRDDELEPPTQAWVHRARYLGPRGRLPAAGAARQAGPRARRRPRRGSSAAGCSSPTRTSPGT